MSHSAGLSYGLLDPGTLIFNAYNERKVINPATTLAEMMDVLADLPLIYHPGTSWEYSVAIDVLARLVEVISGQCFDAFIQSRILGPLGMVDTGFVVSDRNRLVAYYAGADLVDPMKPGLTRADDSPYPGAYLRPFPRQNGGAGLVSTLPNMVALARWKLDYNTIRPHSSIGNLAPADYAKLSAPASQRDGTPRAIGGFAPRPVAAPSQAGSNGQSTLLI